MESGKQRIWVLSELFYPAEAGTGHYMTGISVGLAATHDVKVITCGTVRGPRLFVPREHYLGIEIFRIRTPAWNKKWFLLRFLQIGCQTLGFAWEVLFKVRHGDMALVVTSPPSLPIVLVPLLNLKGVRTILRVDDLYPDAMVAAGIISDQGLLFNLVAAASRFLYRHAQLILTLGRDMQEMVCSRIEPDQARKVVVIPNWADSREIVPQERDQNSLRKELGLSDKFVFLVAGNIGRVQGIPALTEAAEHLAGDDRIRILFIGDGALQDHLKSEIIRRNLFNVICLPVQPRAMQNTFLNACDVAVLTLAKGMRGVGVPSRMYNYMAAGKPLFGIVDEDSEPGLVIVEEGIGWVARPGDAGGIARLMTEASLEQDLAAIGTRSRQLAVDRFSKETIVQATVKAISECPEA